MAVIFVFVFFAYLVFSLNNNGLSDGRVSVDYMTTPHYAAAVLHS